MRTHLGHGVCLITYRPAWARDMPELKRYRYLAGEGTEEQRVAYADQQGGYHDMRVTLCLAAGLTVDQIHPVTGHALVSMGGGA